MESLWLDLKFGAKLLLKEKGFSLTALLTLALSIGANAAIFTVIQSMLLRPLPFPEPDRLVAMYNRYPGVRTLEREVRGEYVDSGAGHTAERGSLPGGGGDAGRIRIPVAGSAAVGAIRVHAATDL
jgi:hypothetical protein